jgi:hypothetical protein
VLAAAALIAALDAPEAATRREAALAVGKFPEGLEAVLPTLLRMLERDSSAEVRSACDLALGLACRRADLDKRAAQPGAAGALSGR